MKMNSFKQYNIGYDVKQVILYFEDIDHFLVFDTAQLDLRGKFSNPFLIKMNEREYRLHPSHWIDCEELKKEGLS